MFNINIFYNLVLKNDVKFNQRWSHYQTIKNITHNVARLNLQITSKPLRL